MSKKDLWKAKSTLIGYKIDNQPIDINDLSIGRQRRKRNRKHLKQTTNN
jgi:hypothetical protein